MEKLVYVMANGTKETDYNKVKGTEYTVTLEPVKEVETPEQREIRLQRIEKAKAGISKAYAEYLKLKEDENYKGTLYGVNCYKPKKPTEEVAQA